MGLKIFRLAVNCETMFYFQFWLAEESKTCRRLNDLLYGNKNSLSLRKVRLQIPSFKTESLEIFAGRRLSLGEANALAMGVVDNLSRSLPLKPLAVFASS